MYNSIHTLAKDFAKIKKREQINVDKTTTMKNKTYQPQLTESEYGIKTHAVIKLDDLIAYSQHSESVKPHLAALEAYRSQYGVK